MCDRNQTVVQAVQPSLFGSQILGGTLVVREDDARSPGPSTRALHENSLAARERHEVEFRGRKGRIIEALRSANRPLTDREILEHLYPEGDPRRHDMNLVRPRVTELIHERRLEEIFERPDHRTGERVRVLWLT
jgi:hypothetical protein